VYIDSTFAGASGADGTFRNYSGISDMTYTLAAGLTVYKKDNTAYVNVGYQQQWGDNLRDHRGNVNFGFRF